MTRYTPIAICSVMVMVMVSITPPLVEQPAVVLSVQTPNELCILSLRGWKGREQGNSQAKDLLSERRACLASPLPSTIASSSSSDVVVSSFSNVILAVSNGVGELERCNVLICIILVRHH